MARLRSSTRRREVLRGDTRVTARWMRVCIRIFLSGQPSICATSDTIGGVAVSVCYVSVHIIINRKTRQGERY
jgi:hypothetical protein